jgi:hypothetical protein
MPRYVVKYQKPGQIEGNRIFDIGNEATDEAIQKAAELTAGPGATIVSVEPNDQSISLGERKASGA